MSAGEGKKYLRVTKDFSEAWHLTGRALAKAGFTVADEDRDRGVYFVDFTGAPGTAPEQAGFLSSLAFWRGDETEHEVQLTGIGEKTEVVVLDNDGNWESGPVADEIRRAWRPRSIRPRNQRNSGTSTGRRVCKDAYRARAPPFARGDCLISQ